MDKPAKVFRFGPFELRTRTRELYKHGIKLKLRPQPFQVLHELLNRPGELVTREELREKLWSSDTFVDFEQSLNTSIKELRGVLGDSATEPRYVETVPRLGYRFIAPVEGVEVAAPKGDAAYPAPSVDPAGTQTPIQTSGTRPGFRVVALLGAAVIMVGATVGGLWYHRRPGFQITPRNTIVLADFANTTGEGVFDDALKQGLNVGLEQSPMIQILSDEKSAVVLKQMGHSGDQSMTGSVAIEVCQRSGSRVTVQGFISSLGTAYLIGLTAIRCDSGERIAHEQVEARRKEEVIDALGRATSQLRSRLGESLPSIQKYDASLEQATTSSLEALKAYGLALAAWDRSGDFAAVSLLERAIELDSNFALAYSQLAAIYGNRGEIELARKYATKAYELRARTTEFERLSIESWYHAYVTGDLEKATAAFETTRQAYPEAPRTLNDLGTTYGSLGLFDRAVALYRDSLRVSPLSETTSGNLAVSLMALGRNDEAGGVLEEAGKRGLQSDYLLQVNYWRAFLLHDTEQMSRLLSLSAGVPGAQSTLLSEQADTEAYSGHFKKARQLSLAAASQMQTGGQKEAAGLCFARAAIREAEIGDSARARDFISRALDLSHDQNVVVLAALVMARTGEPLKAISLAEQLDKENPSNTFIQKYWLPLIHAETEIHQGKASQAVDTLNVVGPLDWAAPDALAVSTLFPAYARGQAYLAAGEGSKAAAEFQKLIDHPGMVLNFPLGALARLGIARAHRLAHQNTAALKEYDAFLALWKDADPDIPILRQAKREYQSLQ
jgi:DNA-binding winged helix-turn-helix (wHTH) protein/tetratricopeptide (TPR) repeat protein